MISALVGDREPISYDRGLCENPTRDFFRVTPLSCLFTRFIYDDDYARDENPWKIVYLSTTTTFFYTTPS